MNRRLLLSLAAATGFGLLSLGGWGWWSYQQFLERPIPQAISLTVANGWSFNRVATELEEVGAITSSEWLFLLNRLEPGGFLQAGEYLFPARSTPRTILNQLRKGEVVHHRFTIPEGWTVPEVARLLQQTAWPEAVELLRDPTLPARLELTENHLEGWLFPATYDYRKGEGLLSILKQMVHLSRRNLEEVWSKRPSSHALTPYQTLILASIVEKETGQDAERPAIAGVFYNRLSRHMRLQSDPTVIYGVSGFDGNLTRLHLRTDTPYNTYTREGLPPTPICNPGREALEAVVHPLPSTHLYFVAKGDGSHIFASSLPEHQGNVQHYQKAAPTSRTPSTAANR
ncbi:MAG: endolytic transglycosylase MltG [Magnetococcales bacterium]|nr:endolytic transglycosylase MltG [Magnetococcales bacterium]